MSNQRFEYATGRFCDPAKIIDVSVYPKQVPGKENPSEYVTVYRIAITLDVANKDKGTIYSDAFESEAVARQFALSVPNN